MADPVTPNLGLILGTVGADEDTWGDGVINPNMTKVDAAFINIGTTPMGTAATHAAGDFETAGAVLGVDTQTGSYTLALADAGKVVEINSAGAATVTIPPGSAVAFPINARVDIVALAAGQVTVAPGAGVTLRSAGGKTKLSGQYSGASLYKRAADDWVLIGDLTA